MASGQALVEPDAFDHAGERAREVADRHVRAQRQAE
jgi:hypothetical protein